MTEEILTAIREADMVLVGLGEEFDNIGESRKENHYIEGREQLEKSGRLWLLPAYDKFYQHKESENLKNSGKNIVEGLGNLAELIKDKNYFVISTAMNDLIYDVKWKEGRLVMPCGGIRQKQCVSGCEEGLQNVSAEERKQILDYIASQEAEGVWDLEEKNILDICPTCGKPLILNNIYAENYDEKGYLADWQIYTKWLQGTLNKKLVILELGVGMRFPSVIRWPFEKVAFFNNKAHIFRINEKLYQLSEELKGKGTAIPKNSIDWLTSMC